MAIYGGTLTAPTVVGTHSGYVAQIKTGDFHTDALTGANKISNGGGNLQIYTDSSKTTRLPIDIVECVTGVSPSVLIYCRVPSMATATTLYVAADDVQTIQPAVGAPFGRNAVWVDNGALHKLGDLVDSTGNGYTLSTVGSPTFGGADPFGGTNSVALGGASDWLENTSWLNWGSTAAVSVWVKTNTLSTAINQTVFSQNTSASETSSLWDALLIRNAADWEISRGSSGNNGGTPATSWKQVHVLFTSTGGSVYENGVFTGTNTQAYNSATKTTLFLGALVRNAVKIPLNGSLSLFRVYSATTLSPDYIATEHDNQSSSTWFTNDGWNLESGGSFTLDVDGGIYSTTGGALSLLHNRLLSTGGGVYSSTGSAVSLLHNRVLEIDGGTYSTTGANISLLHNRAINVDGGIYSYTGSAVDLIYTPIGGYTLDVDGGVFTSSVGEVDLLLNRAMQVDGGNYSATGANVATLYNRAFNIDGGSFSYSGANINLLFNRALQTDGGVYSFTGGNVGLVYSGQITLLIDCYSVQFKQDEFTIDYQQDSVGIDYGCL